MSSRTEAGDPVLAPVVRPRRGDRDVLVAGGLLWTATLILSPAPLPARILLLAPLVVIPMLVPILPGRPVVHRIRGRMVLAAAAPLVLAISLPQGVAAAACSLPWLAL